MAFLDSLQITTMIVVVKTVILVLGGLLTYFAYKAYSETGARPLRLLSIGFGIVTLGALLGGVVHQAFSIDILMGILIQSLLTMVGFAVLTYSLYVR